MSIVDPSIVRRERASRRPSTLRVLVTLGLILVGGFLTGYGWGGAGASIDVPDGPGVATIVAIPLGMLLLVISSIAWVAIVMKRSDIGVMYGHAAGLLGIGAGVFIVPRNAENASVLELVALIAFGLGLICLILGVAAAATRRLREATAVATMRTGQATTATVTDKGYTRFRESDRILTTVTFGFTDLQGVQRWVQRMMTIHISAPVENGQQTRLWYDAGAPGDDKRIVVELARESPLRPR
ncbi:hypothetical protein [Leifsonia poae]|uniref:hypothetical protein n=1 Tax=Leifsonia poae TaxID=110933 RepID=UPI001CBFC2FF|nr:hypothetical protein [Leifsonia poae]